jgi:PAS domain-containing protein
MRSILEFIKDPLGIGKVINTIKSNALMLQDDINFSIKKTTELTKIIQEFQQKQEDYELLLHVKQALDSSAPDMFWVKDVQGRYIIANKAIRDNLLLDDYPYGKDDREIAENAKKRYGDYNHTFGAICGNSDADVLKRKEPTKYNEDGLVRGKYLMLQVHKNVIHNNNGDVIGTVGSGRDITYQYVKLNEILESTKDQETREALLELLTHYKFDERD